MQQWQELLQQHGIYPEAMVPDVLALPRDNDTWSLYRLDDRYLLRTGANSGIAVDVDNIGLAMQLALEDEALARPARLVVYGDIDDSLAGQLPAGLETLAAGNANIAAILGKQFRHDHVTDLQQGEFTVSKPGTRDRRFWRITVALLLAWLVVESGMTLIDNMRLASASAQLKQQIETVYRDTFPGARNVPNPQLMMERQLRELHAGSRGGGFLTVLSSLGQALNATGGYRIERLTYSHDLLDAFIVLDNVRQLDSLKKHMSGNENIVTEVKNARTENNQVHVHLRLRSGA
jgi:general secretion pathway protein L